MMHLEFPAHNVETGTATIMMLNADCFDVFPLLTAKRYDTIIIDPPFYTAAEGSTSMSKPDVKKLAWQTKRLLKQHGTVWLFGNHPGLLNDYMDCWRATGFDMVTEMILLRRIISPLTGRWHPRRAHMNLWVLKLRATRCEDLKLDWRKIAREKGPSKREPGVMFPYRTMSWERRKDYEGWPKSVQVGQVANPLHPWQKPLSLMIMIIQASTDEGDWVLDPFAGSGTTAVACKLLNRNCVAIEIDPQYYDVMVRRVEQAGGLEQYVAEEVRM